MENQVIMPTDNLPTISFLTTVTKNDWDSKIGGWRCSALKIPGAGIDTVYVNGDRADKDWIKLKMNISAGLILQNP